MGRQFKPGQLQTGSLYNISASYALTASFALNGGGGASVDTGSLVTTASFNQLTASYYAASASFSSSISLLNNATSSYVLASQTSSMTVLSSSLASTASYVQLAQSASYALYAVSASYEINYETSSSYAETASIAISSSYATSALTASYVLPLKQEVQLTGSLNISGSTTQIGTNNLLGQTNLSGSIYVSGSMNALADLTLAGTLRLDPAQDPGNTNATASFLFTSASNTEQGYDLYYRQDGNLVKFKWLEGGISSGLLYGGVISASGATIFVSSGSGILLDPNASFSKEINPIFTYVTWPNYSAPATYLTSSQNTYIYIDAAGTIHQQTNFFDQTQYEQAIPLGRVTHPNYSSITGIGSNVQTTYDSDSQQSAFVRAFGPIKIDGFSINAHPGTLGFGIGSGVAYTLGGFYSQDPNSPSHYHGNAFATSSIARAYRSGSGVRLDNNGGAFYSTIDPDYWDDGTGVLNTMASGDWQIQRVFANPVSGRVVVYYGQNTYTTLINALQYLATDSFTEGEFTAHSLIFVGYLVLKGQTNNLTDTNNNRIINAGIFRNIAGGSSGGGAVAQTLDDLSDVTTTTPSNGQALIYNSGTWINGTPSLATSASWAPATFPYTGSAIISGSLGVTGSASILAYTSSAVKIFSVRNSANTYDIISNYGSELTIIGRNESTEPRLLVDRLGSTRMLLGGTTDLNITFPSSGFGQINTGTQGLDIIASSGDIRTRNSSTSTILKGNFFGIGQATPAARLDVRAQGALSTDVAFRVRNSADNKNIMEVRGDAETRWNGLPAVGNYVAIKNYTSYDATIDLMGGDGVKAQIFHDVNSNLNLNRGLNIWNPGIGGQATAKINNIVRTGLGAYGDGYGFNWAFTSNLSGIYTQAERAMWLTWQKSLVFYTGSSSPIDYFGERSGSFEIFASSSSTTVDVVPHFKTEKGTIVWIGSQSRLFNVTASNMMLGATSSLALFTSVNSTVNVGTTTLYAVPTASYDGVFIDYTARSGSNARAGQLMGIWSGSAVNYTETTTTDFGSTAAITFGMSVSSSTMIVSASATTAAWSVKTIIRSM